MDGIQVVDTHFNFNVGLPGFIRVPAVGWDRGGASNWPVRAWHFPTPKCSPSHRGTRLTRATEA